MIGESPSEFEGIVYVPRVVDQYEDLLTGEITFEEVVAALMPLETETPISAAIDAFQAEHQELALVLMNSAVVGLVTATALLESIMGQIEDPLDRDIV